MIVDKLIYTLSVGDMDQESGPNLRAETREEGGIVTYLAGQLVARRLKPGVLVHFYVVSWESGNLFSFVMWDDLPTRNSENV